MRSYWRWNVHIAGIRICTGTQVYVARLPDGCRPFLLLWPWPWPDDLHIRTWPVLPEDTRDVQIRTYYVKASTVIVWQSDRQNRPNLSPTPLCGWWARKGGNCEALQLELRPPDVAPVVLSAIITCRRTTMHQPTNSTLLLPPLY